MGIGKTRPQKSWAAWARAEYFFTPEGAEEAEPGKEEVRIPDPNPFFLPSLCTLRDSDLKLDCK